MEKYGSDKRKHLFDSDWRFIRDLPSLRTRYAGAHDVYHTTRTGNRCPYAVNGFDDSEWRTLDLPHDWLVEMPFDTDALNAQGFVNRGVAWYRKDFILNENCRGKQIKLCFDGVAGASEIYVNGSLMERNFSSYNEFTVDLSDRVYFGDKPNSVAVFVDRSDVELWAYEGAGIHRHVWLYIKDELHIAHNGIWVKSKKTLGNLWAVSVEITVENSSYAGKNYTVNMKLLDENGIVAAAGSEKGSSLKNYEALYQDMLEVTEKPKRALVTVIGITNQMDYFNQNYENQQQISGLIVADNGQDLFILTEYRIVENVERIQVTFWDETMVDATYQRHDPSTGFTIVKVDKSKLDEETRDGLAVAPLGSSYLVSQGDPVVAVGSPVGYSNSIAYGVVTSVTNKISALDNEYNLLTTDILGSTDGSGILVNLDGEIVGIIAQSYSAKGNNVVTGIAISQIKKLIENLSNNVSRAYIGIRGQDVTEELSDKTGIPKGVLISRVADDSPAMMAGMKEYDVIVKLGEHKVETIKQYHEQLGKYSTGDVVTVTAMRKGAEGYAEMTFDVTMGEV